METEQANVMLTLTWDEYGELVRLLDRAAEFEAEAGWSTRSLTRMVNLLRAQLP